MNKQRNRLKFGTDAEKEYRDTGIGFGMIENSGTIRKQIKKTKLVLSKKMQ